MLARSLLLLSAFALTSCASCIDFGCFSGFRWDASVPSEWTAEQVEEGIARLCVNGACEESPIEPRDLRLQDDGSLWLALIWELTDEERASLADGDVVSLTLLAADGTPIMGIAETTVTYEVIEGVCDVGYCISATFEGSTL
jgi:hypothetical protein